MTGNNPLFFMNTFFRRFLFALLLISTVLLRPAGAALNPGVVAAEAQWVVFADMNALRASVLGQEIVANIQRHMPTLPPSATGIDFNFQLLLSTIGNVTAYGVNLTPSTNV